MIGLAAGSNAEPANSHYPTDDANSAAGLLEARPLLDMRLEITNLPRRIDANGIGRGRDRGQ